MGKKTTEETLFHEEIERELSSTVIASPQEAIRLTQKLQEFGAEFHLIIDQILNIETIFRDKNLRKWLEKNGITEKEFGTGKARLRFDFSHKEKSCVLTFKDEEKEPSDLRGTAKITKRKEKTLKITDTNVKRFTKENMSQSAELLGKLTPHITAVKTLLRAKCQSNIASKISIFEDKGIKTEALDISLVLPPNGEEGIPIVTDIEVKEKSYEKLKRYYQKIFGGIAGTLNTKSLWQDITRRKQRTMAMYQLFSLAENDIRRDPTKLLEAKFKKIMNNIVPKDLKDIVLQKAA